MTNSCEFHYFINEKDVQLVISSLRVAAERYDQDAIVMREQPGEGFQSTAKQFDNQAADARRIADAIEEQS